MKKIFKKIVNLFSKRTPPLRAMEDEHKKLLATHVIFYQQLGVDDRQRFESRCMSFLENTAVVGHDVEVTDLDCLLLAAGSVILAWGFDKWHYVKVDTIFLVSKSFNQNAEMQRVDSHITGLVGTHHLRGKMILSQPALRYGFSNEKDKRNVVIHEFAHLIDMADGDVDGLPEQLADKAFSLPWLEMVTNGIDDINRNKSNIREYGATNNAEFFAVVSEYFFEQPKMLKRKEPELYTALEQFYKQNRADLDVVVRVRKKAPCPCGSGKRYKRCCMLSI